MQKRPFYRAFALMAALSAAASGSMEYVAAMNAAEGYRSRGKGLGKHSGKKWGARSSGWYSGVSNGEREMARRQRQIAAGTLQVSPIGA